MARKKTSTTSESPGVVRYPIDYPLPFEELAAGVVRHVYLATLAELEEFWRTHRAEYPFAAHGVDLSEGQRVVTECEWFFAREQAALIRALYRLDEYGTKVEWYDWASEEQAAHELFFIEQVKWRETALASDTWSDEKEAIYQQRTPTTYRGWWHLVRLPPQWSTDRDRTYEMGTELEEITDRSLSKKTVERRLLTDWFVSLRKSGAGFCSEVQCLTAEDVDEEIVYAREERDAGNNYYGCENE